MKHEKSKVGSVNKNLLDCTVRVSEQSAAIDWLAIVHVMRSCAVLGDQSQEDAVTELIDGKKNRVLELIEKECTV
jgi:hypothetical protein